MDTHFLDFLHNLSRDDSESSMKNFKNIQLAGYLSHRHNQADQRKWVLIVDRILILVVGAPLIEVTARVCLMNVFLTS